jgi:hypothetical protein
VPSYRLAHLDRPKNVSLSFLFFATIFKLPLLNWQQRTEVVIYLKHHDLPPELQSDFAVVLPISFAGIRFRFQER